MGSVEKRLDAFFEYNNNITPLSLIHQDKTHAMQYLVFSKT